MEGLDDGERAPPVGSAKPGAAPMEGLDDGEPWDGGPWDDFDGHAAADDESPLSPEEREPTLREVLSVLLLHLDMQGMLSKLSNPIIFEDEKIPLLCNDELRDFAKDVFGPTSGFLEIKKELYDVPSPQLRAECLKTVDAIRNAPDNTGRREAVRSLVRLCCSGTVVEEPVQGSYEWYLMEGIQQFLLDSYHNCNVAKAWFLIYSVLEDGTIMQSDGKVAPDSFQPKLPDLARHRWLLGNVHENPQLSKFELVRMSDGGVYWGGIGLTSTHLKPLDHMDAAQRRCYHCYVSKYLVH